MDNLIELFEGQTVLEAFAVAERIVRDKAEAFGESLSEERITGRAANLIRKAKAEIEAHRANLI